MNKRASSVRECTLRIPFFLFVIEIVQSETTKSHMSNTSLNLTNQKYLMAK